MRKFASLKLSQTFSNFLKLSQTFSKITRDSFDGLDGAMIDENLGGDDVGGVVPVVADRASLGY